MPWALAAPCPTVGLEMGKSWLEEQQFQREVDTEAQLQQQSWLCPVPASHPHRAPVGSHDAWGEQVLLMQLSSAAPVLPVLLSSGPLEMPSYPSEGFAGQWVGGREGAVPPLAALAHGNRMCPAYGA